MKTIILTLVILLTAACTNLPSPSQEKQADYGAFPEDYQQLVRDYLMQELRDPPSVEIANMSYPKKRWIGDTLTGISYGYLICVKVNSKDFFGKLTGFRSDAVLIRNGFITEHVKDGELISGMKLCD